MKQLDLIMSIYIYIVCFLVFELFDFQIQTLTKSKFKKFNPTYKIQIRSNYIIKDFIEININLL